MFKKEKMAKHLEENKLSWKKFAEQIGVTDTMVGYLLKGFKQPSVSVLHRIAKAMGCTMDELVE